MSSVVVNQLGIDQLEWLKSWVLVPTFIAATVVVFIGVFLEREEFKEKNAKDWMAFIALGTWCGNLIWRPDICYGRTN